MSKSKLLPFSKNFPTVLEWSKGFKYHNSSAPRAILASPKAAADGLAKLNLPNIENMTAVELYPGLGTWTTALRDKKFKRIIALEPQPPYHHWMKGLCDESKGVIELLKQDGYDWSTYQNLRDPKYLGTMQRDDWSEIHPDILFTGVIPTGKTGEQLLAQFSTCIGNKMAMHTLGRIQMAFWLPDVLYQKYVARPNNYIRCKMSVITEACAEVKLIHTAKSTEIYPNSDYHLVSVVPFEKGLITSQWDVFEYVLRHLFVMQKKPLTHMVKTLGPGADIILGRLSFDPSILIGAMTVQQLNEVAVKFDQWPLRPRILFEDSSVL